MSQQGDELVVGATIPAGAIVLLSSGSYSDYGEWGIFRASEDTVVPGLPNRNNWRKYQGGDVPDLAKLSAMLDEVDYVKVHNPDV